MSPFKSNEENAKERGLAAEQVAVLHKKRGLNNSAISAIPEDKLRSILLKLEYQNFAIIRADFRQLQERNENGVVPPNALSNALHQLDSFRTRDISRPKAAGLPIGK